MATIKDVALEAGVSIASVSRVLNDPNYGSVEMRMKVTAAAKKLGYQPNKIARSMVMGRTNIIALVIPDIRNQFFTSVARGVEDVASKYEYRVMLCNTDENSIRQRQYIDTFRSKIVDGFIIAVASDRDHDLDKVDRETLPFVFIDRVCEGVLADAIVVDNRDGAYKAVSHLLELGHRRIGLIAGKSDTLTGRERLRGYEEAYRAAGITVDQALVVDGNFTIEGGYQATKALLEIEDRPTAIFAANNSMTIGCLRALTEAQVKVPEDVSVIGFDDSEWAEFFVPPLTVVRQPTYSMGTLAAEILFQRLTGTAPPEWQEVVLKPELVIRASCGPVRW
ncbi:MAG: LacI family transcriptional regulator [Firmicutes bacterium]|jgi:DNA-binding LacI/PurR family transcriptional regulator|nr:LacI family transcriptional regulator [Bacillota bacterium]